MTNTTTGETVCGRCNGARILKYYLHVEGGVCYECRGRGFLRAGETRGTKATQTADRIARVRGWYRTAKAQGMRNEFDLSGAFGLPFATIKAEIRIVPGARKAFDALGTSWGLR